MLCDFQLHHSLKYSTSRSEAVFLQHRLAHPENMSSCLRGFRSYHERRLFYAHVRNCWLGWSWGHAFNNVHPSAASAPCCCCNGHPHTALMLMLGSSNRRCRLSETGREVRGSRKVQCALLPRLPNQQYYLSMARACGSKGCPHGVAPPCFLLGATKIIPDGTAGTYTRVQNLERLRL